MHSNSAAKGRRDAFELLAGEVYGPLQRYIRRRVDLDAADDLVSETMLTLWRRLDDLPETARLPWAYGVARHHISNHRRAVGRHLRLIRRIAAEPAVPAADPPLDVELDSALAGLGEADREILRLWAWERLEPAEIGVVMGITSNAAAIRLHRAKRKLTEKLASGGKNLASTGHSQVENQKEEPS